MRLKEHGQRSRRGCADRGIQLHKRHHSWVSKAEQGSGNEEERKRDV